MYGTLYDIFWSGMSWATTNEISFYYFCLRQENMTEQPSVNTKQALQKKKNTRTIYLRVAFAIVLDKGPSNQNGWEKKNAACVQAHALDLKIEGEMIACIMSIHLLTKSNHTVGYKIWYQPLKTHAGYSHLSSPRCAPQQVLIMTERFRFAHNVTFFAMSFHMSL